MSEPVTGEKKTVVRIGRTIAGFELIKKLGDERSAVFLAKGADDREVVVKILPVEMTERSPKAGQRFLREARALFGRKDKNVVKILDAGEELGTLYLVMEHFPSKNLRQLLEEKGEPLSQDEAIEIFAPVLWGLAELHADGLVHRNLQPEHVLIDESGEVKLAGLGLVKGGQEDAALTAQGRIVGTPRYMSPEQARGEDLDGRSDLFSLGVTLYEALSGKAPWDDKIPTVVIRKLITEPHPPIREYSPDLDPGVALVVDRLLAKQTDARYASSYAVLEALEPFGAKSKNTKSPAKPAQVSMTPAATAGDGDLRQQVAQLNSTVRLLVGLVVVLLVVVLVLAVRSVG
jgi:eukaryotic-like serine/threonine-protein kinase